MSKEKEAAVRAELVDYQTALDSYNTRSVALEKQRTKLIDRIKGEFEPRIDFLKRQLQRIEAEKKVAATFSDANDALDEAA